MRLRKRGLSLRPMSATPDLAQIRLQNALVLFDEFVHNTIKHPDAATLRGLEGRFAEQVGIQPSYWSQIKSRARQIGERLARQFEQQCKKPMGWMDREHASSAAQPGTVLTTDEDDLTPCDGDERFIMGLVLTYYRRHPQRARQRLLDLLGEVLMSSSAASPVPTSPATASVVTPKTVAPNPVAPQATEESLWQRSQQGVAPLRRKK